MSIHKRRFPGDRLHYDLCVTLKRGRFVPENALVESGKKSRDGFYFMHEDEQHDIRLGERIGLGASGTVRKGTFTDNGALYELAVKINNKRRVHNSDDDVRETAMQLRAFCAIDELTRAKREGMACVPRPYFIIDIPGVGRTIGMQQLQSTLLDGLYQCDSGAAQIKLLRKVLHSVAHALEFLQSKFEFMHGDLHPGNVMNVHSSVPCIIDFGMASTKYTPPPRRPKSGSERWGRPPIGRASEPVDKHPERLCADGRYEKTGFVPCLDMLTLITCVREDLALAGDMSAAVWCDRLIAPFWTSVKKDFMRREGTRHFAYGTENMFKRMIKMMKIKGRLPGYTHHLLYEDAKGLTFQATVPKEFKTLLANHNDNVRSDVKLPHYQALYIDHYSFDWNESE